MKKPRLVNVFLTGAIISFLAACGAPAVAGHGGGGGGHGGGGGLGGGHGGFGGGFGGYGGGFGGYSNSWGGHGYSGSMGRAYGGAIGPSRGVGVPSLGNGTAAWASPHAGGVESLGRHAPNVDLLRSSAVRAQAFQAHHPWDSHFHQYSWNHHWHDFYHYWHHFPYAFGFWPFWDPFWYYGFNMPYVSNYMYYYGANPYDLAACTPVSTPVSDVAAENEAENENEEQPPEEPGADAGALSALRLYSGAREAFRTGDYRDALRLANHAAIESPQNPKVHELISLSLFALGDYRGAAIEAHAALAFGPPADWATLAAYYGDAGAYTKQLRALEKYVGQHKSAPEGHFLSAYHYLMIGGRNDAKNQMAEAAKLTPKDKLAAHVLRQLEAGQPVTPPRPEPPKPQPPKPAAAK